MSDAVMEAATVYPGGRTEVARVPVPDPAPGEVLVRMAAASICGSDLHQIYDAGRTVPWDAGGPGHEGVGYVARSRSRRFDEGDFVLTAPDASRGRCFAEYQVVPEDFLVPVPRQLDPVTAVLAQQLGTVLFALKKFCPEEGRKNALVLGCGPAGLAFVGALKRRGASTVVAVEPRAHRREAALRMGADLALAPDRDDVPAALQEITDGRGADLVVEASGTDASRRTVPFLVARDGRIGFFGLPEGPEPVPFRFDLLFSRRAVVHFSVGAQFEPGLTSFRAAVDLIAEERDRWAQLVSHRLPLTGLGAGLRLARDKTAPTIKVVIELG